MLILEIILLPLIMLGQLATVVFNGLKGLIRLMDRHEGFMTFLATLIIAIFTVELWWVSRREAFDAEAIQRAFVFFQRFDSLAVIDPTTKKVTVWDFQPVWENSGTTPTKHMVHHISRRKFDSYIDEPTDDFFRDQWDDSVQIKNRKTIPILIGPKATFAGSWLSAPMDWLLAVQQKKAKVYFYGWTSYSDVFNNQHLTRFCYEMDRMPVDPTDPAAPILLGLDFCPEYNCADDDCHQDRDR